MKSGSLNTLLIGASIVALSQTGVAFAQQDETAASQPTETEAGRRLGTVTVNATRRESSIQDVPIAVTALDADAL